MGRPARRNGVVEITRHVLKTVEDTGLIDTESTVSSEELASRVHAANDRLFVLQLRRSLADHVVERIIDVEVVDEGYESAMGPSTVNQALEETTKCVGALNERILRWGEEATDFTIGAYELAVCSYIDVVGEQLTHRRQQWTLPGLQMNPGH